MKKNVTSFNNKFFFVSTALLVTCLFLFAIFPTANTFQKIISSLTFLFVIPLLYIKIVLRRPVKNFGLQLGKQKEGFLWAGVSVVFMASLFYVLFNYTGIGKIYQIPEIIRGNFFIFLAYEFFLVGFFLFLYEFFFVGFFMLGLIGKIGWWSILAQGFLFIAFLLITGNLNWAFFPYIIALVFSGAIAHKSRSIYYSFGASLFFIIIADAIAIGLTKT